MKRLAAVALAAAALTVAVPATADAHSSGRCPEYEPILARHGLPVRFFSRVLYRESHCDPQAVNINRRTRDHSLGLAQINMLAWRRFLAERGFTYADLLTVEGNIAALDAIYERCGTRPWVKPYGCRRPR